MQNNYFYMIRNVEKKIILKVFKDNREIVDNYQDLDNSEINNYIKKFVKNDFSITWALENKNKDIVLDEPLLMLLLGREDFVDENFKKIKLKKVKTVSLIIKEKYNNSDEVETFLEVNTDDIDKTKLVGSYAYIDSSFYDLNLLKGEYDLKELFTVINKYELETYLTLILKNFKNLYFKYEDYQTVQGTLKEASPQIVIEKITPDNSLFLKVNSILSTMDYHFFIKNQIENAVIVNELEKKLYISKINTKVLQDDTKEILKSLNKLQKFLSSKSLYYVDEDFAIILTEQIAKEFVKKNLLQLATRYNIIGTDKLKKYNIKTIKPRIIGNFSYNIDYFEGNLEVELEGEKISIQDFLNNYRKNDYITLSDGTNALINKKYIEKLERIFKIGDKNSVKISFFDLPLIEDLIEEKIFSGKIIENKKFFEGINKIGIEKESLPALNANLRDYQKYGYKWLKYLMDNNLGACLADDMGLGKTLQTIAVLVKLHSKLKRKTLIIMPKSLIYNWENEILKFAPSLKIGIYYGTNRDFLIFEKVDIVITTYGTVRNDIERIMKLKFDLVILDESQNIKNINSQTTKAVMLLKTKNRIALSGTPIENNLLELYSLFRFLNPSMFKSSQEFNENYIVPIQKYGDEDVMKELRKKIYPFILRRVKKEVLKDLPPKIEKVIYVDMNEKHRKYYEERRRYYHDMLNKNIAKNGLEKSKFFVLQALNELRHITSSPEIKNSSIYSSKKDILIENIIEAIENNHKVLVFVNYISSIDSICKVLEENGIEYLKMTGKTKDRQTVVDKFQNNNRYKVFIMTLKTGGVGLNLTSADTIFIYEPWWNKTVENQAIDRAYRLGQDKTVFSYKLILKDTIEEKILKLQELKSKLLDDLISEDNLSAKSLSASDIEFILGG